jgi:hypothetical protein
MAKALAYRGNSKNSSCFSELREGAENFEVLSVLWLEME